MHRLSGFRNLRRQLRRLQRQLRLLRKKQITLNFSYFPPMLQRRRFLREMPLLRRSGLPFMPGCVIMTVTLAKRGFYHGME